MKNQEFELRVTGLTNYTTLAARWTYRCFQMVVACLVAHQNPRSGGDFGAGSGRGRGVTTIMRLIEVEKMTDPKFIIRYLGRADYGHITIDKQGELHLVKHRWWHSVQFWARYYFRGFILLPIRRIFR